MRLTLLVVLALAVSPAGCAKESATGRGESSQPAEAPPRPDEGIPLGADELAARLRTTDAALDAAIDRWRQAGGLGEDTPRDVLLYALYEQRIYRLLTPREQLSGEVLERVRGELDDEARDILAARRELSSLSAPPQPRRRFATGPSLPPAKLMRLYRKAERRFHVSWKVLAAVNFVETSFNKLRNKSTAGAQGPMQFIPSTWDAYGMGGDIHDPHDAIMGAANYLHASGAPGNYRRALYAYNPSDYYVDSVLGYTRRIRRDKDAFLEFHSWQVFVSTPQGIIQITGPGAER
jgi:membrane-bound lytic murein transglycosylase B